MHPDKRTAGSRHSPSTPRRRRATGCHRQHLARRPPQHKRTPHGVLDRGHNAKPNHYLSHIYAAKTLRARVAW